MKPDLRRIWGAALAVVLATVGCSGQDSSPDAEQPVVLASTQAAAPASAYTGPDEFTLRERFMPVLRTQQEAAEHGLADVTWLGEPAFQYRQSMNNTMVASLHVTGTTSASAERADAWLQHANEGLAAHGFVPAVLEVQLSLYRIDIVFEGTQTDSYIPQEYTNRIYFSRKHRIKDTNGLLFELR